MANLQQAVTCFQEALRFYTPATNPLGYAGIQASLGLAYAEGPSSDGTADLKQAIACLQEALRFHTLEAPPSNRHWTAGLLGQAHCVEQQWEEAHIAYDKAIAAGEVLYQAAATEVSRQFTLQKGATYLFPSDAYTLARLSRFREVIERLELGRARTLTEALARNQALLERATPGDRQAFEAANARIKALEVKARSRSLASPDHPLSHPFPELSLELTAARQKLAAVANRIRTYVDGFMPVKLDFEAIAAAAPGHPLVYLITTMHGSLALIVPPGIGAPTGEHVVWLNNFRDDDLDRLLVTRSTDGDVVGGYLMGQVEGNFPLLKTVLEEALPSLRESLMGPLTARLSDLGFCQATLIPGGRLGLLPLHAADFEAVTFSYVPSARVLLLATHVARARAALSPVLLGIGNPLSSNREPLAFARIEVEEADPFFAAEARHTLYEGYATRVAALRGLSNATHLHFACHGTFDAEQPLNSALFLSGNDTLTLHDLLDGDLDLSASRMAVLSACQTGIIDFNRVPDEVISFPTGLLQAGVPGVVSTLWPVNDLSTAVLLRQFYYYHLENNMDPATALHEAQKWLRDATASEMKLVDYYKRSYETSGQRDANTWKSMRYYRANPGVRPFEHPYYWAAFVFSGV